MANRHSGLTILETMIALSILVIMVLGVNQTISLAIHRSSSIYYRHLALLQKNNMQQMLDANQGVLTDEMQIDWNRQNALVLPNGSGDVSGLYPDYSIALYWSKDDKLL